jgi:hypothetical protein
MDDGHLKCGRAFFSGTHWPETPWPTEITFGTSDSVYEICDRTENMSIALEVSSPQYGEIAAFVIVFTF